jgi:Pyruvate/2-oxoacid:ferredoxin oxidoreductase gamma subunit
MAKQVAGTDRAANMISLGAFLALEPVVKIETIETLIREVAFASKPALIEKNLAALHAGMEHALHA